MKKMYSLNEVGLLPCPTPSVINSRTEVNPFYLHATSKRIKLPIFVSPMPCIVNNDNYDVFEDSLVQPILPRTKDAKAVSKRLIKGQWAALSLVEFKYLFTTKEGVEYLNGGPTKHVCIDMADGHMKSLVDAVATAKKLYKDTLVVMVGNIAHPNMYSELAKAGADYIRIGIGGGNACSTSVLTGIHASLPWLIEECYKLKKAFALNARIVADGGIDTVDKAIKCLALGADFVMMGKQFAQCEEACGKTQEFANYTWGDNYQFVHSGTLKRRKYYGNASKEGQQALTGNANKPSEGISTWVEINTTLNEYCKKFENALRSCMSYTGHESLTKFIGNVNWRPMSIEEFKSYYK